MKKFVPEPTAAALQKSAMGAIGAAIADALIAREKPGELITMAAQERAGEHEAVPLDERLARLTRKLGDAINEHHDMRPILQRLVAVRWRQRTGEDRKPSSFIIDID